MIKNKNIARLALAGALLSSMAAGARAEGEDAGNDQRVRMEALEEAVEGLNEKVGELSKVKVDGFVNLRYDDERNPNLSTPFDTNTNNNGRNAVYSRRAEFKFAGKLSPTVSYSLGYDFTENKHKDLGIEIADIPLIPFVDLLPEYMWSLRIGQFRMPFGIAPQTSSSAIWFPERPLMFGGRKNANSQIASTGLFGERAMGLQLRQKAALGSIVKYDLQGAYLNDLSDQARGENGIALAFPSQITDQDFALVGRLSLEHSYLSSLLEGLIGASKWQTGVSYARNTTNGEFMANDDGNISYAEYIDVEGYLELFNKTLLIQSEWMSRQTGINAAAGATNSNHKEGWYVDTAYNFLPLIIDASDIAKGDSVQLIGRLESQNDFTNAGGFVRAWTRLMGSLKWNYLGGKNHTSLTYIVSAPDQMFGGDFRAVNAYDKGTGIQIPETTLIIQQQFAFGN